jgi:DNA invertase Pin-like site-specific DNA recombinase
MDFRSTARWSRLVRIRAKVVLAKAFGRSRQRMSVRLVLLCARVCDWPTGRSTDSQTVENQIRELRQVAGRRGWVVVEVYSDAGISGVKGRNGRPGLDSMLKDASRRKFDIVMAWAIDRSDLLDTIQHLEACGVDLYLDQQAIDTSTPMGKLVFQLTGAFAEFERTMIRQRIKTGLKRAVAQGVKLGRPKIDGATERKVRRLLAKGIGILKVARSLGIGTGTVQRISGERAMSLRGAEQ